MTLFGKKDTQNDFRKLLDFLFNFEESFKREIFLLIFLQFKNSSNKAIKEQALKFMFSFSFTFSFDVTFFSAVFKLLLNYYKRHVEEDSLFQKKFYKFLHFFYLRNDLSICQNQLLDDELYEQCMGDKNFHVFLGLKDEKEIEIQPDYFDSLRDIKEDYLNTTNVDKENFY